MGGDPKGTRWADSTKLCGACSGPWPCLAHPKEDSCEQKTMPMRATKMVGGLELPLMGKGQVDSFRDTDGWETWVAKKRSSFMWYTSCL